MSRFTCFRALCKHRSAQWGRVYRLGCARNSPKASDLYKTDRRTYSVRLRRVRATTVAVEKQWVLSIELFIVALVMRAMRMRRIVICGLSCCTVFAHIISWTARFSGKKLLNTECVFWFSLHLSYGTFLVLKIIKRVYCRKCTYVMSEDFIKIHPVGTELSMRARGTQNRQTHTWRS